MQETLMSTFEKLIQKIFSDSPVSYKEAENVLLRLGYSLTIQSSHYVFRKHGRGHISLKKRDRYLAYQLKDLRKELMEHGYKKD